VTLDIFDVIQLGSEGVGNVDDNDLPVCLALIEESHDTKDLDLFDLTSVTDLFADLANVEGIVVALGLGLRVRVVGILPSLEEHRYFTEDAGERRGVTNLRECTVVPDVTVMGEAVANETQTTLLDVLLDWIEWLLLADLELCVGPTGDLDNHVEDAIALVGKERNVVEWGDDGSILFRIDAMFWRGADESTGNGCPRDHPRPTESVWGTDDTRREFWR
jgi:hypothetical protein